MLILKITPFVYNYMVGTLDTQQNEPTNQNSLKVKTVIVEQSGNIIG